MSSSQRFIVKLLSIWLWTASHLLHFLGMSPFHPWKLLRTILSPVQAPVHLYTLALGGCIAFILLTGKNGHHQKRSLLCSHHQSYWSLHLQPGSLFTSAQWWAVLLYSTAHVHWLSTHLSYTLFHPFSDSHTRTWWLIILLSPTLSSPSISSWIIPQRL